MRTIPAAGRFLIGEIEQFWDDYAEVFRHVALSPVYGNLLDEIVAGSGSGNRLLDLGSGPGYLAVKLARAGASVVAVDGSSKMCRFARDFVAHSCTPAEAQSITLTQSDVLRFLRRTRDGSFDTVVANLFLSYARDRLEITRHVHRVLVPGGRFVLCNPVPNARFLWVVLRSGLSALQNWRKARDVLAYSRRIEGYARSGVFRFFTQRETRQLLSSAGFPTDGMEIRRTFAGQAYLSTATRGRRRPPSHRRSREGIGTGWGG